MATAQVTGLKEIDRKLHRLSGKGSRRVVRAAVGAMLKVIGNAGRKGMRTSFKKKTGLLHKAVGSRNKKSKKTGEAEAKAGVNVAKKKGTAAPHGHLAILGTVKRKTSDGKNRGAMPRNDAFRRATAPVMGSARQAGIMKGRQVLKEELQKL